MLSSHLSDYKIRKIIGCFFADLTAAQSAKVSGFNRNTINRFFKIFRLSILHEAVHAENPNPKEYGEFELDESYFGARRARGKRGRGAAGKTVVFGILKRGGKVHLDIVKNASRKELMPIIQGKILEGSKIHTDGWKAYNGLILNGYDHYRIFHHKGEFARGKRHVNGIESFWSFAKCRLSKFKGFSDDNFFLHLKESEFRFNNRGLSRKEFENMLKKSVRKYLRSKKALEKVKNHEKI